jgi:hypothetical protein
MGGSAGRGLEAAGSGATSEPACADLIDDGAPITPHCPITAGCPTAPPEADCTFCEDCAGASGIDAAFSDGTYELVDIALANSACGSFDRTIASGVLVVSGSTLTFAWTRPVALGSTAPSTATYALGVDGDAPTFAETCPETSEPSRVSYATSNGVIYFSSPLPGQVDFSSVFELRR